MLGLYKLVDGKPVKVEDTLEWARWIEESINDHSRTVAYTVLGEVMISTVFLATDHNFSNQGPPVLWETMIFGGDEDGYQERYTSVEDAKAGHERAVKIAKGEKE